MASSPRVLRSILGAQPHGGPAGPSCASHHPAPSCRDPGHGPLVPQRGIEPAPAPAPCLQLGLVPWQGGPGGGVAAGWWVALGDAGGDAVSSGRLSSVLARH